MNEVVETLNGKERNNLELIFKWGCDGSQQQTLKQKFQNSDYSDANIFQSSFVPLRLISHIGNQKKVLWQNPTPSSTRYCRPIKIHFIRESKDVTIDEIEYVENQIKGLRKSEIINAFGGNLQIKYIFLFTMIDGKVCNAATNTTSTMRCYICGQSSKDFNDLNKKTTESRETLKFGLSILHARIRFFDTSRRFFADPLTASRIAGVDITLIKKCNVILEAISSGHQINVKKFENFGNKTAELYVDLYGWHPMSRLCIKF